MNIGKQWQEPSDKWCSANDLPMAFKAGFCFGAASAADAAAPEPEGELIEALVPAAGDGDALAALGGSDMPGSKR